MAPLTRSRAGAGGVPTPENACYYAQRASAGLIISEAADVAPESGAFAGAPGIYTDAQLEGWRRIAEAVHERKGRLVIQLVHSGRVAAEPVLGRPPVAPSALDDDLHQLQVWSFLQNGRYARVVATRPEELSADGIERVVAAFGAAARNAALAGADGVEVHAAHGYLLHQFLSSGANRRTDAYGGSAERRLLLLDRVLSAIRAELRLARVGVRISPFAIYNSPRDEEQERTYPALAALVARRGVAYLHVSDMNAVWGLPPDMDRILAVVRPAYPGAVIACGGLSPAVAGRLVAQGAVDAVAFGRLFIANPDLVERIGRGGPYNALREDLPNAGFYGGGAMGYTDDPALAVPEPCRRPVPRP
jgi:2,4-dienoyl-CoA reductase-like NADH-dependent reductase (Old Yellow Enzyme family)